MPSTSVLASSPTFRQEIRRRGGESAARCYQCATCSSVCELAPAEAPFPRRQMLWAQWGLADRLAADPAVWLCHQCNDCNVHCPRDAQPGDVLQVLRSLVIERLSFPFFAGRLVGRARTTWPLLIGLPIIFWALLLAGVTGFAIPAVDPSLPAMEGQFHYERFVPHILIYVVYALVTLWVVLAVWVSGRRFWRLIGTGVARRGSFVKNLLPVLMEIATHSRFSSCSGGALRRWGHFLTMWGFAGAAVTSGILIAYLYGFHIYPLPLDHWVKWLGNVSAVALVLGGVTLYANRRRRGSRQNGDTTAFDRFFLGTVLAVIFSGVLTEAFRFIAPPWLACTAYVFHLGVVLTLFLTFPYSKFAHLLYRTLALVHQREASREPSALSRELR